MCVRHYANGTKSSKWPRGEISWGINWDNGATDLRRFAKKSVSLAARSASDISSSSLLLLFSRENVTESAAMHIQRNESRFNEGRRRLSGRREMRTVEDELAVNWD